MTDRPVIFSAPMIHALIDGRKTQARRVLKPQPDTKHIPKPYAIGDRLWVRECFSYDRRSLGKKGVSPPWYWADGNPASSDWTKPKPSICMPRWASRLTLIVTDVRVQRLQEITQSDAQAEGAPDLRQIHWPNDDPGDSNDVYRRNFCALWRIIHGPGSWDTNPWVVALTFAIQLGNIDAIGE